ncbi:MAG: DUF1573 domain-containing protein [Pirellulales bacterium]
MRLLSIIVAAAIVGATIGAAIAYIEVRPGGVAVVKPNATAVSSQTVADAPRVDVHEPLYNFGTMQRGTTKSHEFVVNNVGKAPLTLKVGSTTCKCTIGNVSEAPIAPGDSVKVKLEWSALINPGPFRQVATIITNDPVSPKLELSVEGEVTDATGLYPPDFIFDKVTAGQSKTAEVYVMALAQDDLQISSPELSNTETRNFFDVSIEPVEPKDLPNPKAKAGARIRVVAKPGLRMGRFDQWLAVKTNIPDAEQIKIPIFGRVVGNVSIHGLMWNEDQGVLRLGKVKSSRGIKQQLNIVVRGEHADDAKIEVASTDPPELKATLGESKKVGDSLVHLPLTVEIPPGTPPMARLDIDQHDEARIVLKSSLPDVPEIVLQVRFAVER